VDVADDEAMRAFRDAASLASRFCKVTCRSTMDVFGDVAIRHVGAAVVCKAWGMMEGRIDALMGAVADEMPGLRGRLLIGADVTIRRSLEGQHGTAAPYERHNPSAVHSDSWDGTVLGFALTSSKLGTPCYPEAVFPCPIGMFLSQSKTGRNEAYQLDVSNLGPLRPWIPRTLVIMPATTAHSKPSAKQIQADPLPEVPRWFCRATLRVAIAHGFRSQGRTHEARSERLALALIVATHVWGDPIFANAARELSCVPRSMWVEAPQKMLSKRQLAAMDQGVYEGDTKDSERHGFGICVFKDGSAYEGEWKAGQKHGKGKWTWSTGRVYDGQWEDDAHHGLGTFTFVNGRMYTGMFKRGKPVDQAGLDQARDGP